MRPCWITVVLFAGVAACQGGAGPAGSSLGGALSGADGADAPAQRLPLATSVWSDATVTAVVSWDAFIVIDGAGRQGFEALGSDPGGNIVYQAEYAFDSQEWTLRIPADDNGNPAWPSVVDPGHSFSTLSSQLALVAGAIDPSAGCLQALGVKAAQALSTELASATRPQTDVQSIDARVQMSAVAADAISQDVASTSAVQTSDVAGCASEQGGS